MVRGLCLPILGLTVICVLGLSLVASSFTEWKNNDVTIEKISPGSGRIVLSYLWPTASPETQGLDSQLFQNAFDIAARKPYFYSILAVRGGKLIAERYFNGQGPENANYIASASKSVLSALIGIALDRGDIPGLGKRMMDYFPEYRFAVSDPVKYTITLRHLLTMRSGLPMDSNDKHWQAWWASPDWMRFCVTLPLAGPPGEKFRYSTSGTHILSGILTKATGMKALEYARLHLCAPLGISIPYWPEDPLGYNRGGWDIHMTPRDMARFGYLYLKKGDVDGVRILSEKWITDSLTDYCDTWDWGAFNAGRYGYLWWKCEVLGYTVWFAHGHGGQCVFLLPEIDMILITTADAANSFAVGWNNAMEGLNLVTHYLISPILGKLGPAPYPPADLTIQMEENRGLGGREFLTVLRWNPENRNLGMNIIGRRIYRLNEENRIFLGDVDAGRFLFWHRSKENSSGTFYGVTSFTADGRESGMSLVKAPLWKK